MHGDQAGRAPVFSTAVGAWRAFAMTNQRFMSGQVSRVQSHAAARTWLRHNHQLPTVSVEHMDATAAEKLGAGVKLWGDPAGSQIRHLLLEIPYLCWQILYFTLEIRHRNARKPLSAVGEPTYALGSSGASFGPGIHHLLLSNLTTGWGDLTLDGCRSPSFSSLSLLSRLSPSPLIAPPLFHSLKIFISPEWIHSVAKKRKIINWLI